MDVLGYGLSILHVRAFTLSFLDGSFNVPLLAVLHAMRICARINSSPAAQAFNLPHYLVAVFVMALGGSSVVSIALGRPLVWLMRNETIVTYLLVALAMRYTPQLRKVANYPLVSVVCAFADGLCRATAAADSAVEVILRLAPVGGTRPLIPCILAGFVASLGGGFCDSVFGLSRSAWKLEAPSIGLVTSSDAILAVLSATVYSMLRMHPIVTREHAFAVTLWLSALGTLSIELSKHIGVSSTSRPRKQSTTRNSISLQYKEIVDTVDEEPNEFTRILSSTAGPVASRTRSSRKITNDIETTSPSSAEAVPSDTEEHVVQEGRKRSTSDEPQSGIELDSGEEVSSTTNTRAKRNLRARRPGRPKTSAKTE